MIQLKIINGDRVELAFMQKSMTKIEKKNLRDIERVEGLKCGKLRNFSYFYFI